VRIDHPDGLTLPASFLIDKTGLVQHQVVNNLSAGRNVDEMIRTVDVLQFSEQHGNMAKFALRYFCLNMDCEIIFMEIYRNFPKKNLWDSNG